LTSGRRRNRRAHARYQCEAYLANLGVYGCRSHCLERSRARGRFGDPSQQLLAWRGAHLYRGWDDRVPACVPASLDSKGTRNAARGDESLYNRRRIDLNLRQGTDRHAQRQHGEELHPSHFTGNWTRKCLGILYYMWSCAKQPVEAILQGTSTSGLLGHRRIDLPSLSSELLQRKHPLGPREGWSLDAHKCSGWLTIHRPTGLQNCSAWRGEGFKTDRLPQMAIEWCPGLGGWCKLTFCRFACAGGGSGWRAAEQAAGLGLVLIAFTSLTQSGGHLVAATIALPHPGPAAFRALAVDAPHAATAGSGPFMPPAPACPAWSMGAAAQATAMQTKSTAKDLTSGIVQPRD